MTETQACDLLEATLTLERVQAETDVAARLMQRCRFHPLALDIAARLILKLANDGVAQPQAAIENRVAQQIAALKAGNDERTNLFAVFQISYDDLNVGDQTRFQKLAVFAPGVFGLMHRLLLSVSTIGTNELQQNSEGIQEPAPSAFQFPQSERTNCNIYFLNGRLTRAMLSVSTIGTNELQLCPERLVDLVCRTFSFHNRNERTATCLPVLLAIPPNAFSFHNRNERTATVLTNVTQSVSACFQFPQSERTNCNTIRKAFTPMIVCLSVSTIGTNELQPFRNDRELDRLATFQFPQSERTNCNPIPRCQPKYASIALSVSTIGTNELQRIQGTLIPAFQQSFSFHNRNERTATPLTCARMPLTLCLSVSTIGTNELQLGRSHVRAFVTKSFQFPQSERTNCNGRS